jgi:putative hemolysin
MIAIALLLLILGLLLSAFFSGNETGFYRASRVRIVMAALAGDRTSKLILGLINHPSWFVATALIGNNIANYLVSLSIVLLASLIPHYTWAELVLPLLFTPLLFIYGELLPKNLFYSAPNQLLRWSAPVWFFFTILFSPLTIALWWLGKLLEKLLGESPEQIRLALAKRELQQFLQEGLEARILMPTQSQLAQSFFLLAARPVREFCTPLSQIDLVPAKSRIIEVLARAQRKKLSEIPVVQGKRNELVGYVRTIDLLLEKNPKKPIRGIRKIPEIKSTELYGEALIQMQSGSETMMKVVNPLGQTIGLVTLDQLTNPMLQGQLDALQR